MWRSFVLDGHVSGGAKFVDKSGILKPSSVQASELTFDRKSEHLGKNYIF